MAVITNNAASAAQLAVRIDVLERVKGTGLVSHGAVKVEAEHGVVRSNVSFWVGDREIFRSEVFLHQMTVSEWMENIQALVDGEFGPRQEINFGFESPELMLVARRSQPVLEGGLPFYELTVVLDAGSFDAGGGIIGEGPAMFFTPKAEVLLRFSSDLLAEVNQALAA